MRTRARFIGLLLLAVAIVIGIQRIRFSQNSDLTPPNANNVKSWHFHGWKLVGGKQLPWEIWGRREPFFFYERLGEAIRVSDATTGTFFVPPLNGKQAVVIHNTQRAPKNLFTPGSIQSWDSNNPDPRSGLPRHYALFVKNSQSPRAELDAEFDVEVPPAPQAPLKANGAFELDLATVGASGGVSVKGKITGADREGNLDLVLRAALARAADSATLPLNAQCAHSISVHDNLGVLYLTYYPKVDLHGVSGGMTGPQWETEFKKTLIRGLPLTEGQARRTSIETKLLTQLKLSPETRPYFREDVLCNGELSVTTPIPTGVPAPQLPDNWERTRISIIWGQFTACNEPKQKEQLYQTLLPLTKKYGVAQKDIDELVAGYATWKKLHQR